MKNIDSSWKEPRWNRERKTKFWDPGKDILWIIRKYQKLKNNGDYLSLMISKLIVLLHIIWSIFTGADIPLNTKIEGGLLIPHPNGIVIHPDSKIGPNCLIFQQVTLAGMVILGYHVDIGAGAKLIGPIKIGNNVVIGANSVVNKDIPSNSTVIGIPGRIISK